MKKLNFKKRSTQPEIMDEIELGEKELTQTLKEIEKINLWLGGNKVTLKGIAKILKNKDKKKPVRIGEIGSGNGAMLRKIADWARKKQIRAELTGIDINRKSIALSRSLSKAYPEISFLEMDATSDELKKFDFDIYISTLTLHHFNDREIKKLMANLVSRANTGVVINDLHRSKMAYRLFQIFCTCFVKNEIAREDGLTSISRSFKRRDLEKFSKSLKAKTHSIKWKWAFRYQWIIQH